MHKLKKGFCLLTACLLAAGAFSGCSSAGESAAEVSGNRQEESVPVSEPSSAPEPEQPEETVVRNPLTGEPGYNEEALGRRPVTVMINNIGQALPQRGIAAADVMFEIVVEGGITRMMGVYADIDQIPYVGPVRSARHYYVSLSEGLNAIYTHFGGSPAAYNYISQYGVDDVDGQYATGIFYQDTWRAQTYGREHSFFIDGPSIRAQAESEGISLDGDFTPLFDFYTDEIYVPDGGTADDVYVPFSGSYNAGFVYDGAAGLYEKYRNGEPHIDADTGETVAYRNVLILYSAVSAYGDGTERRELDLSSGDGWFVSAGGREAVTWEKGGVEDPLRLSGPDGEPLSVNVGKTYICITDGGYRDSVTFTGAGE